MPQLQTPKCLCINLKAHCWSFCLKARRWKFYGKNLRRCLFHYLKPTINIFITHLLEIVDRYCQYVLDYMDNTYKKDRQTYQHVPDYLTEIKYVGGVAHANAIINTLLIKYPRSPALVGKLRRV